MSKKNQNHHREGYIKVNKNMYPLPDRTVLYSKKKYLKPIPQVGKRYHCFDDGKVTFSRHYIVKIKEVLGQMAFKKKYPSLFKTYLEESKDCYWLYSRSTDVFVVSEAEQDRDGYAPIEVFVRTKQGGWFSISDNWLYSGRLDITSELWDYLVKYIDDYDYTEEEKKEIIKEGTI